MAEHNQTGQEGEQIAKEYLQKKGYQILDINWKFRSLEIDIIASDKTDLVICEVKTRSGIMVNSPVAAVDKQKQKFLIQAADAYVRKNNINLDVRFDIVSIMQKNNQTQIEHLEKAFYPLLRK